MSLISELKKVKKPRGYKMLFVYEADNGIIHLCGDDIIIEFAEKCFDIDVCCDFDTLWSKIKNCKTKDTVSIENGENGEHILKINNKWKPSVRFAAGFRGAKVLIITELTK